LNSKRERVLDNENLKRGMGGRYGAIRPRDDRLRNLVYLLIGIIDFQVYSGLFRVFSISDENHNKFSQSYLSHSQPTVEDISSRRHIHHRQVQPI
jgi:hypothetical protein